MEEIEKKLSGVICGHRPTSCSDQLARACRRHMKNKKDRTGVKSEVRQYTGAGIQ